MPTRSDIIRRTDYISPAGGTYLALYTIDSAVHNNYEVACMAVVPGSTNMNTNEYVPASWVLVPFVFYWKIY